MIETRRCLLCREKFSYEYAGGRPRSFCEECVKVRRRGKEVRDKIRAAAAAELASQNPPARRGQAPPTKRPPRKVKPRPITTCLGCGTHFEHTRRGERVIKYCSRACSNRATAVTSVVTLRKTVIRPCETCGKQISTVPSRIVRGQDRFCSHACYGAYAASGAIQRQCRACGDTFAARSGRHTWCARCLQEEQNRDARLSVARQGMIRADFRERDEYRIVILADPCVWCGNPAETVDHIQPVARGGSDRWDNLAPACLSCNCAKNARSLLENMMRLAVAGRL